MKSWNEWKERKLLRDKDERSFSCENVLEYVILFFPEENSRPLTLFNTRENKELENRHWSQFSPWDERWERWPNGDFLSLIYMIIWISKQGKQGASVPHSQGASELPLSIYQGQKNSSACDSMALTSSASCRSGWCSDAQPTHIPVAQKGVTIPDQVQRQLPSKRLGQ